MYAFHVGLESKLRERKFPIACEYGRAPFERRADRSLIVVQRGAQDDIGPPNGQARNGRDGEGRYRATRNCGVTIWIFCKSAAEGARLQDHEDLADSVVDAVQCSAYTWGAENSRPVRFLSAGFVPPEQLPPEYERFPGVTYAMQLSIGRGVYDRDYDGNGLTEVTLDAVTTGSTIKSQSGAAEVGPETTA